MEQLIFDLTDTTGNANPASEQSRAEQSRAEQSRAEQSRFCDYL